MTPVALWTGRLPGLRPLPSRQALWAVGSLTGLGFLGAFGVLGTSGTWFAVATNFAVGWTLVRHRWPSHVPRRLRPKEPPDGPDERAVAVELRHDETLLGWDVGLLWFEKGGVGFVGETVSFVLPRVMMRATPPLPAWQSTLRAPQMMAKVFETVVGVVPLAPEFNAQMTLARIDALPEAVTSETILPPSSIHPDLLQRGLAVRRRLPLLSAAMGIVLTLVVLPSLLRVDADPIARFALTITGTFVLLYGVVLGAFLPASIRPRLPKEPRRQA